MGLHGIGQLINQFASDLIRKTGDQTVNNSDVLVNVTELKKALAINEAYDFIAFVKVVGFALSDIKFGFTIPAGASLLWGVDETDITKTEADSVTVALTDGQEKIVKIVGKVINGATAGDLQLQFAQASAQIQDTKILKESSVMTHRVNPDSSVSHTHVEADITDLQNYSLVGHTHVEADITDLQNYSLVGHTHVDGDLPATIAYEDEVNEFSAHQTLKQTGVTPVLTLFRNNSGLLQSGNLNFDSLSDLNNQSTFARILQLTRDDADASKDGSIHFQVMAANTLQTLFAIDQGTTKGVRVLLTDLMIDATKKFYLDGGVDSYLQEGSANKIFLVTNGSNRMSWSTTLTEVLTNDFAIPTGKKSFLDGGGDTYFTEPLANVIDGFAGGVRSIRISNTRVMLKASSSTSDPLSSDVLDGMAIVHKNTTSGNVFVAYNDAGTIKKVQLT